MKAQSTQWTDLIGNTPLVALTRLYKGHPIHVYAKLEMFNLGGSAKDRPALHMIDMALKDGTINKDTTIIESSSGNMGIGLALVCLRHGLKFICVTDEKSSQANRDIIRAYGGSLEIVKSEKENKRSLLELRLARVRYLQETLPNSFWINQYENENNARAHLKTMEEIDISLQGNIDYLFCATSTCGTIRGCSDYIKTEALKTKVIGVDALGSVIFGCESRDRLIPGHGSAVRSKLYRDNMANDVVVINDYECVDGCRKLLQEEAIFAGGSSGAIVTALFRYLAHIPPGSTIVLIFPDSGERYLDTIYNDTWVNEHFRSSKT